MVIVGVIMRALEKQTISQTADLARLTVGSQNLLHHDRLLADVRDLRQPKGTGKMGPVQESRSILRHLFLGETFLPQLQEPFLIDKLLARDRGQRVSDCAVRGPSCRLAPRRFLHVFANAVGRIHYPTCLVAITALRIEVWKVLLLQIAHLARPNKIDVPVVTHLML